MMGTGERICRKCKRDAYQKALDIVIGAAASRLDDEELLDCHRLIAIVAERIHQEVMNNLDIQ